MFEAFTNFALIGERYLDTQFEPEYIVALEAELAGRGVRGPKRLAYEYVATSSLWWNVFWWEWRSLTEFDVRFGWLSNLVVFGIASGILWLWFDVWAAMVGLLSLHLLTISIGLKLRQSTIKQGEDS